MVGGLKVLETSLKNPTELVVHVETREKWPTSVGKLGKDTARWPHINWGGVDFGTEEYVGWPIPQSDHLVHMMGKRTPELCFAQSEDK